MSPRSLGKAAAGSALAWWSSKRSLHLHRPLFGKVTQMVEAPHDRPVLALVKNANSREAHNAVWIVAEWSSHAEEWRPVRVHGDPDSGIKLEVLAWNDLTPADDEVWQQPSAFPGRLPRNSPATTTDDRRNLL